METATIYKISCKDELIKDCYIGSTFNFDVRYRNHKSKCNNENSPCYTIKVYQFIRNNGGWDNFKFEILLSFECENTNQKSIKEQEYLDEVMPSLNIKKAFKTEDEKKKYHNECKKKHYKKHKAKFLEKIKCNCGGKFTYSNKGTHEKTQKHQKFILKK